MTARTTALVLVTMGVLAALAWASSPQAGWFPTSMVSSVRDWSGAAGFWVCAVLFVLQATTVVVIPVPAAPFVLANVTVAGPWPGFALSLVATVAGSVVAFLLGRRYGRKLVRRLGGSRAAPERRHGETSDGLWLLPVLCVPVPLGGDVACFLAGTAGVRLRRFAVLASLGRIPGIALGTLLASGMTTGSAVWLIAGMAGFAVLFTAARYHRTFVRWARRHPHTDTTRAGEARRWHRS